mmetsp:Transcript_9808/g.26128  ORF Transcript_9808/g.26128 Transcript_9808/m.26128 type:complete len:628 (+) Transcript_9808:456-2339(+)
MRTPRIEHQVLRQAEHLVRGEGHDDGAGGDALQRSRHAHGGDGRWEDVGLLQGNRSVQVVPRLRVVEPLASEQDVPGAIVRLGLEELDHEDLVAGPLRVVVVHGYPIVAHCEMHRAHATLDVRHVQHVAGHGVEGVEVQGRDIVGDALGGHSDHVLVDVLVQDGRVSLDVDGRVAPLHVRRRRGGQDLLAHGAELQIPQSDELVALAPDDKALHDLRRPVHLVMEGLVGLLRERLVGRARRGRHRVHTVLAVEDGDRRDVARLGRVARARQRQHRHALGTAGHRLLADAAACLRVHPEDLRRRVASLGRRDHELAVRRRGRRHQLHPRETADGLAAVARPRKLAVDPRGAEGAAAPEALLPDDLGGGGLECEDLADAGGRKDDLARPEVTQLLGAGWHLDTRQRLGRVFAPRRVQPLSHDGGDLRRRGGELRQAGEVASEALLLRRLGALQHAARGAAVEDDLRDGREGLLADPGDLGALDAGERVVLGRHERAVFPGAELVHQQQLGAAPLGGRVALGSDRGLHVARRGVEQLNLRALPLHDRHRNRLDGLVVVHAEDGPDHRQAFEVPQVLQAAGPDAADHGVLAIGDGKDPGRALPRQEPEGRARLRLGLDVANHFPRAQRVDR